jgi:hypothetical protein
VYNVMQNLNRVLFLLMYLQVKFHNGLPYCRHCIGGTSKSSTTDTVVVTECITCGGLTQVCASKHLIPKTMISFLHSFGFR